MSIDIDAHTGDARPPIYCAFDNDEEMAELIRLSELDGHAIQLQPAYTDAEGEQWFLVRAIQPATESN